MSPASDRYSATVQALEDTDTSLVRNAAERTRLLALRASLAAEIERCGTSVPPPPAAGQTLARRPEWNGTDDWFASYLERVPKP